MGNLNLNNLVKIINIVRFVSLLFVLYLIVTTSAINAEVPPTRPLPVIAGFIKDVNTDDPISGANVAVTNISGIVASNTTNSEGIYIVPVAPGTYSVTASANGYQDSTNDNVNVPQPPESEEQPQPVIVNFTLIPEVQPLTVIAPEDITTEATGPLTSISLGNPSVSGGTLPYTTTNDAPVEGFPVGTTTVTWTTTDSTSNTASDTQQVTIADTTPPQITLLGDNPVTINVGDVYTDAGAMATDIVDGDISANIVVTDSVNTVVADTYTVVYDVSDTAGNVAQQKIRDVIVTEPPTNIEISGVQFDPPGPDGQDNINEEWVKITNSGSNAVDMTGWKLVDDTGHGENRLPFQDLVLQPSSTVMVHTGSGTESNTDRYLGYNTHIWNNDIDTAILKDENGEIVDQESWNQDIAELIITAPIDITIESADTLTQVDLGDATATGGTPPYVITNDAPAEGFPVGITTVTWIVTDDNGLTDTDIQLVSITEPTISGVSLTVDTNEKQTNVNVNAVYLINVSNTGNVIDTFDLIIQNPQNADVTLNMILSQTSITLNPGSFATGVLNVSNTVPGTFIVNLTATSQNDPTITKTITTTTTVVEPTISGVDLIVDIPNKQTGLNINATYILTITNTGNNVDTFDLTTQNPQNAIALLEVPDTTLNAGQSQNVNLNVKSATPGNFIVNVTATSQTDPTVSDIISTTTTVIDVPILTTITMTPISSQLTVGDTQIFTATAKDQNGAVMAGINITWAINDPAVGDINPKNSITDINGVATSTFTTNGGGIVTLSATNGTVSKGVTVSVSIPSIVKIMGFGFGAGNGVGNRGKMINASINITNSGTETQTFVVVVSGVTSDGFPLVGTGTVIIPAGQTINNIPIILVVPPTATLGTYSLFAGVWTTETFPTSTQLTSSGPIVATIN